jgi:hypothetical protein
VSEHTPSSAARNERERQVSTVRRVAMVATRRIQAGKTRAAVRAQLASSQRQRQEISFALVRLRHGLLEFRSEVRSRLRQISSDAARKRSGQKA